MPFVLHIPFETVATFQAFVPVTIPMNMHVSSQVSGVNAHVATILLLTDVSRIMTSVNIMLVTWTVSH